MIRNPQHEDELTKSELTSTTFITNEIDQASLSLKIKKLSLYLSSLKIFTNVEERDGVKNILVKIPQLEMMKNDQIEKDYQLISNLICCFVDFMKLLAPQIEFEDDIIIFYFKLSLKWLENFSFNIFDIPVQYQLKFDYILDRLAKTNLLSLMINIGMEDNIRKVISTLMAIQGDKRYNDKSANFQNIILIIKGLLEEVRSLTIPLLSEILINLVKKATNREKFYMSFQILLEMKNILSAPINQLIFQLVTVVDVNKEKKLSEIQKISSDEFLKLIKTLCKISNEYLINFLSTINANEPLKKGKIKGATNLDIFLSLFSTSNSLNIAMDYSLLFNIFLEAFSSKTLKENDKYKIFTCCCKFLYLNNKAEMKKKNLYYAILDKIKLFFEEVKSEASGVLVLDLISQKYFKNKKIPLKIIRYSQVFLENKIQKLAQHAVLFNFNIINNKILRSTCLFDLFSEDKKKHLKKLSFLFNNVINRYESTPQYKFDFNERMFDTLHPIDESNNGSNENEDNRQEKSRIIIILFFLTLSDYKANSMLHKYFIECLDICCVVLKFCITNQLSNNKMSEVDISNIIPIVDAEDTNKSTSLSLLPLNLVNNKKKNSKINRQIENSKIKLENESGFMKKLDEIGKNEIIKKEIANMFDPGVTTQRNSIIQSLSQDDSKFSNEDVVIFKKAFMIYLENTEIKSISEFGSLLLNTIDNEVGKGFEFLQTLLSVLFYYVKFNINYILIKEEEEEEGNGLNSQIYPIHPLARYQINKYHMQAFIDVIEFIKKILIAKISNRDVLNYITAITKLFFELKNEILLEQISNLILNEFSTICFENYEISVKYLALLYFNLNKFTDNETYILPNNFDNYLFISEKKLIPIKFINELLKFNYRDAKLNKIIFNDNFKEYILTEMDFYYEAQYTVTINLLKKEKNLSLKRELVQIICSQSEILKYEFYMFLNKAEDELIDKRFNEKFTKKIFNKIYEICNFDEDIESSIPNDEEEDVVVDEELINANSNTNIKSNNKKISKLIRQINNIKICKLINLIFKHFENEISIKPNHQIKLMNIALFNELAVRDHLIKKLEKCLSKKTSIYYQLHALPILTIFFNDPDKAIKKKANYLFTIFINYLIKKYSQYKDYDQNKSKNVIYKYLPEVYMSYILMYFVFNFNLNLLFQSKEHKYFDSIITSYLKILKKITNNKFDSNFLIQNCLKIKSVSLKGKKMIKKMSHVTYVQGLIKKDNYSVTGDDYEEVKNEICNMIIKNINMQFTTDFKYENFRPNIPLIFMSEKDISLAMSHVKSDIKKEDLGKSNFVNANDLDFDLSKIEAKVNTSINSINLTNNQVSNKAVRNYKLQLEPDSKTKIQYEDKKEIDEFEDLPYYNKYRNRRNNENEDGDDSEIIHESEKHPIQSKNDAFDNDENIIKDDVIRSMNMSKLSGKTKNKEDVENKKKRKTKTKK